MTDLFELQNRIEELKARKIILQAEKNDQAFIDLLHLDVELDELTEKLIHENYNTTVVS